MFSKLTILRFKKLLVIFKNWHLLQVFIKYKVLAAVEHKNILSKEIKTLIDIGANRGQFSLAAISKKPNINIFAFEPLQRPAIIYKEIFRNNNKVKIYDYAIGDEEKTMNMNLSSKDDSSSLLKIAKLQTENFPGTEKVGEEKIKVAPLDRFLDTTKLLSPVLLKLDVQGFELQALKGTKSLFKDIDYIYCECSFIQLYENQALASDVINFLYNNNFNLTGAFNMQFDTVSNCIQADFLFEKVKE